MDKDQLITMLAQLLMDNMGNRITNALATGIVSVVNQQWVSESMQQGDQDGCADGGER